METQQCLNDPQRRDSPRSRIRYERDLSVIFAELGYFEATAHGRRLRFLVVEREGERSKFRLVIPLYFDAVHWDRDGRRLVVDECIYDRHKHRGTRLSIPLERLRGRGGILPSPRRYDEDTCLLLADMERVILGKMGDSVVKYIDPPEPNKSN